MRGLKQHCWLINSAVNVYVCNDQRLITDFIEKPTKVKKSIVDSMSPRYGTVWIRSVLEDGSERVILNLRIIFYLSNSLSNLISLSLLNDANIFYDNKRHNLYDKASTKPLTFAQ